MMFTIRSWRRAALAIALGSGITLSACTDLLQVENRGALNENNVNDVSLLEQMVNGAINQFQRNFDFMVFAGAILSDEGLNGHNYEQWRDFDLRIVEEDNIVLPDIYVAAQSARGMGDEMVRRIRPLVDEATSMELATALTYTGYSYIQLGEYFCFAPVDPKGEALRSEQIFALAVERFEEAIAIASKNSGNEAKHILNLARVGAARASLGQMKKAEAIAFAREVPADYVAWVKYVASPTTLQNYLEGATNGTNRTLGLDPYFVGLSDRRVRHDPNPRKGHNQQTDLYTPFPSSAHVENWDPDVANSVFTYTTPIRLASGLEARYIIAEAGGMSESELRAFIDERRAVGGQPVPFTGTDLQAELRDQRRRDLFLDGHRLGDIRRYRTHYGVDHFPSGPHPNNAQWGWGNYQTATCYIPHMNERLGNPNYKPLSLD